MMTFSNINLNLDRIGKENFMSIAHNHLQLNTFETAYALLRFRDFIDLLCLASLLFQLVTCNNNNNKWEYTGMG